MPTQVAIQVTPRDTGIRGSTRELSNQDALVSGVPLAGMFRISAPAAPGTTNIVAATAGTAANALVVAGQPDVPRNLRAVFAASYDAGNITVTGTDQFDQPISETLVAVAATTVVGTKIFKSVLTAAKAAVGTSPTVSIGTGSKLGVPHTLQNAVGLLVVGAALEGVVVDPAVSGFTPTTAPNGSANFTLLAPL